MLLLTFLEFVDVDGRGFIAHVVAEGVTLVGDYRSEIHFVELTGERLHGGTGFTVHNDIEMRLEIAGGDRTLRDRLADAAFAVGAMAGHAGAVVHTLAAFDQFSQRK